jgi:hypothetical protein
MFEERESPVVSLKLKIGRKEAGRMAGWNLWRDQ